MNQRPEKRISGAWNPEFQQKILFKEQVGLIDLTPTVLSFAGLPLDKNFQGRDLQDELKAVQSKSQSTSTKDHSVYSITDPWMPKAQFSVRTLDWKYIQQEDQTLVYQLSSDPKEEQNIHPCISKQLFCVKKWANIFKQPQLSIADGCLLKTYQFTFFVVNTFKL